MPIDIRRVIRAAVEAALEDPVPQPRRKRRLSGGRALLVGAGLMTAGKLAASSRGREIFGTIRHRVEDIEDRVLGADDDLPGDEEEFDEEDELYAQEDEPHADAVDEDDLDERQGLGEREDNELDEDEPEPEFEDDEEPSREAPNRRGRGRK
jgi:hypothetical protein